MRTFPGAEYGPDAPPPSEARIQQISVEQCQPAVRQYLGDRYDPNSRFTISMLWAGDKAWKQSGERRMLCGLQLPGADNQQIAFKGRVADLDQSKVWPAGTCLGIDPSTNQPTDVPVDCSAPHAMEVTGTVNLAEKFPGGLPSEQDQDAFIKDACTRMTDAFLAPLQLRTTTLTLIYSTISLPSWTAGSHQVACSIGATLGNGGWATLLNSARARCSSTDSRRSPAGHPQERLNLPPIVPMPTPDQSTPSYSQSAPTYSQSAPTYCSRCPTTRSPASPASRATSTCPSSSSRVRPPGARTGACRPSRPGTGTPADSGGEAPGVEGPPLEAPAAPVEPAAPPAA